MATFTRQESCLERTFYRALHELSALRKLKLVLFSAVAGSLTCPVKINNIHPADPSSHPGPTRRQTQKPQSTLYPRPQISHDPHPNPRRFAQPKPKFC